MTDAERSNANTVLNSATLLMGLTKSGKSSLLCTLAEWGWETFRAQTFYYLVDGGGFPTQAQALINHGIMRLWRVRSRSAEGLAPETMQRASMGWWPAKLKVATGECDPNVRLVAPMQVSFLVKCPDGHPIKTVSTQAQLIGAMQCPQCKKTTDRTNMKVERITTRTKGFPEKRIVAFDGISAAQSWLMDDLSHRNMGGEQSNLGGVVLSGDMSFGSNNRAQYGFAQGRAENWVLNSLGIPDLVVPPVWTALSEEGSDEGGLTVVGPKIAGSAKTAEAPQWFGNAIEAAVVERDGKKYRTLYLQQFLDSRNRRHLVGVRSYPGALPPVLEDEDTGDGTGAFTNFNLGLVHRLLDDARAKTEQQYTERYPDAPGLGDAEVTFGEEPTAPPAGTPAAATAPPARPAPPKPAAQKPAAVAAAKAATPATAPTSTSPAGQPAAPAAPLPTTPAASPAATAPAGGSTQPAAPAATTAPTQPARPVQPARPAGQPLARPATPAAPKPAAPAPAAAASPSPATTGPVATAPPPPRPPAAAKTPPPPGRPPAPAAAK